MQSRNIFGLSDYSSPVGVLAAQNPDKPDPPHTVYAYEMIEIQWDAPYDAGSPIIAYDIQIQKSDGVTFAYDLVNCDGTDPDIVANSECFIPIQVMLDPPFNYVWG